MSDFQHFHIDSQGDVAIMRLSPPQLLDRLVINELQDEMVRYIQQDRPQKLVINFDGVSHCSTEMITALLKARKYMAEYDGHLRLCSMRSEIRQVLKIMNLDGTVFQILDNAAAAQESFQS